ncbi:hypothetical protein LEP1GSC058_2010 [Leptospira fainei serovar Hurstbridge str. BUT 6]|uniref:Uncharacterized protein n=1 Tax=Leptospira fainei serovar Hurstbridge str. BUT 6 TaxID=1193011 RepID=S3V4M8_9LEPT|nr:hypothetical protein LEP1GSC058_2010 [Leptospira fainei serovar Hurstbridge str. BUT 6]
MYKNSDIFYHNIIKNSLLPFVFRLPDFCPFFIGETEFSSAGSYFVSTRKIRNISFR